MSAMVAHVGSHSSDNCFRLGEDRQMTNRQLVYRFCELPYALQREMAAELGLVPLDESFEDAQLFRCQVFVRLGKDESKIDDFKRRFDPMYKPLPPTRTHPCE